MIDNPLPWTAFDEIEDGLVIYDANGLIVHFKDHYKMIITAVNSRVDLLAAAKGLLRFNEELCAEINVSKHYPSAEKARAAIAKAELSS